MNLIDQYFQRSQEIIGERTPDEERYDNEVLKWLKRYGKIRRAISKVNKKYPNEALKYDDSNIGQIASHYEYLAQHIGIVKRISQ